MKLIHPVSVNEIAALLEATLISGNCKEITGINEIHKVTEGDLSFVDHPKYYKKMLQSATSVVLINTKKVENPLKKTLIISDDPFRDYNKLVRYFTRFQPLTQAISPDAEIGENTVIQKGAVIGHRVKIGRNCIIYPYVVIYNDAVIGDNVIIHANTVIGSDAFYYQKREEGYVRMQSCGRVVIKDKVEIGAGCTIDRGVSGDTIIGEGTKIDNCVHVGHGVEIGKHCLIAAQVGIAGKTIIEDHVTLWGQAGISKDLTIGEGAVIMAQSGVGKTIAGGKAYLGSPVSEARSKWKEMALVRKLPEMWELFKKLEKNS